MKIAIVNAWAISNKAIGGTERFVMDLAKSFVDANNEVDVYMFSGESHKENGVNYININFFNIDGEADEYVVQDVFGNFENKDAYINLAKKLEEKIDMNEYDFIQLNSLLFLEAWKNKKRIFTIHTNPFEYVLAWGEKSFNKVIELMKLYKDDESTRFVVPSRFYANEFNKLTNCSIKFIPHAIDVERLYTDMSKKEINKKYNLNNEKIKIIVPSRLEPKQKQPQLLIEACCLLPDKEKSMCEIVLTGLDKQYEKFVDSLLKKATENNLDVKIKRFDYIAEAYKIADICVLPSKSESFGYSALESLIMGIYTILNDIPTFNEIVEGNHYNYVFQNNAKELKEKLLEQINLSNIGARKLPDKKWQEKYSMKHFQSEYIKLLK